MVRSDYMIVRMVLQGAWFEHVIHSGVFVYLGWSERIVPNDLD